MRVGAVSEALDFDPWAIVNLRSQNVPAAKAANPANREEGRPEVAPGEARTATGLAGLAGLAGGHTSEAKIAGPLSGPLRMRPPCFAAPARWWSEGKQAWCIGCSAASTWHPDPPPAPNPTTLHWRCLRCEAKGRA